jgi:hypothetical protein
MAYLPEMTIANMYARPAKMPTSHEVNTTLMLGSYSRADGSKEGLDAPGRCARLARQRGVG